jgi:hypothetical protein
MMGCGGGGGGKGDLAVNPPDLAGDDLSGVHPDLAGPTTTVSGFTVDIDKLSAYLAMNPTVTDPGMVIMNSCVPGTPVYAILPDGSSSATVMADASCDFTVTVPQNVTVHMVAATNTATFVLNTYSQDNTASTTMPVANIPAHVCTSNMYSAPVGVAKTLAVGVDVVLGNGICMFGTQDNFTPPFVKLTPSSITVTQAGWDVYALTDPTTMPPTFVKQANSPIGIYGIYNASNTAKTTITVNATAASPSQNTYAPFSCDVKPGFITFGPASPVSTSTH